MLILHRSHIASSDDRRTSPSCSSVLICVHLCQKFHPPLANVTASAMLRAMTTIKPRRPKAPRPHPDLSFETALGQGRRVCGIDEVGRGPLAGPVVAAAVV